MAHAFPRRLKTLRNIDVDESGDVGIAQPCQVFTIVAFNTTAATNLFLKIYDIATAPTVGTTTPKWTIPLKPALQPTIVEISAGADFTAGVGLGATTAIADADTGAPGDNNVVVNILYK